MVHASGSTPGDAEDQRPSDVVATPSAELTKLLPNMKSTLALGVEPAPKPAPVQ
jgi:hypothetical protein